MTVNSWLRVSSLHGVQNLTQYRPQLFNVKTDPNEITDISGDSKNEQVLQEMESILTDAFNYEYIDCVAKQNDFVIFEEYFWNVYNQSDLYQQLAKVYDGFNDTDWETIVQWRQELLNAKSCEETYNIVDIEIDN